MIVRLGVLDRLLNIHGDSPDEAGSASEAARLLLAPGGVLDGFKAPVALIGPGCAVLAANAAARERSALFAPLGDLARLVQDALRNSAGLSGVVPDTGAESLNAAFEFTILPVVPGSEVLAIGRDVTLDRSLREALVDSRRRYKDLVELSGDFAWETDRLGRFVFVSPRGGLGYTADALVGRLADEFLDDGFPLAETSPFAARREMLDVDIWFRRPDGSSACLVVSSLPVTDADGRWAGARGICRDVTRGRQRDAALALAEMRKQLLAHVIRSVRDEIDPEAMLKTAAVETARALGASRCRIYRLGEWGQFKLAAEFGDGEVDTQAERTLLSRLRRHMAPVATLIPCGAVISVPTVYQKELNGAVMLCRDAAEGPWDEEERGLAADVAAQLGAALEQIETQAKLRDLSRTDELSGLLNRRAFYGDLRDRLGRGSGGALLFIDLDNFKQVNDVHGHARGDAALVAVADLLKRMSRPGDLVGRLGGDEFALWLERADAAAAENRARQLLEAVHGLSEYSGDAAHPLGFSLGIAAHDPAVAPESVTALTDRADAAMYRVKHGDKGGYALAPPPRAGKAAE